MVDDWLIACKRHTNPAKPNLRLAVTVVQMTKYYEKCMRLYILSIARTSLYSHNGVVQPVNAVEN